MGHVIYLFGCTLCVCGGGGGGEGFGPLTGCWWICSEALKD